VDVIIDQARNYGAALEIDDAGLRPGKFFYLRGGAEGENLAVADGQGLARGRLRVDGEDFAVEEDGIGVLRSRGKGQGKPHQDKRRRVKQADETVHGVPSSQACIRVPSWQANRAPSLA
jgi:hypothetical protein